jgi:broad specificity phosphatase PhoE
LSSLFDSGRISAMNRLIATPLLFFVVIFTATAGPAIFFVRHAEKATAGGDDMDLSESGRVRAESLASLLKDAEISAIYTTEFKRTRQTAAPLAKALQLEPAVISSKDQPGLIAKLRASSGNVLVVGHSNTIPDLLKTLGITTPISIADNDYSNLFVVLLDEKPRLLRLQYH